MDSSSVPILISQADPVELIATTVAQLNRIIPGYARAGEKLAGGGVSSVDGTAITGELNLV